MGKKRGSHQLSFDLNPRISTPGDHKKKESSENGVVRLNVRRDELVRKDLIDQFDRSGVGRLLSKREE